MHAAYPEMRALVEARGQRVTTVRCVRVRERRKSTVTCLEPGVRVSRQHSQVLDKRTEWVSKKKYTMSQSFIVVWPVIAVLAQTPGSNPAKTAT